MSSQNGYEFDGYRFESDFRRLTRITDGTVLHLPPRVLEILGYLLQRPGQIVPRAELMRSLWPNTSVEENSLDRSVSLLRRALGEKPGEQRFIATAHGRGYRFVARVRRTASSVEAGDPTARRLCMQTEPLVMRPSAENIRVAIELLQRATEHDAGFARAWAVLAVAYALCPIWDFPVPGALDASQRAAQRALELDPRDGAPHTALGLLHAYRGDWQAAEAHLGAADSLPNDAYLKGLRNCLAWPLGRFRESLKFLGAAYASGLAEPFAAQMLAFAHQVLGEDDKVKPYLDEAEALGSRAIVPHPDILSLAALRERRHADAARLIGDSLILEGRGEDARQMVDAIFCALGGSMAPTTALAQLRRHEQRLRSERIDPVMRNRLLIWYSLLGAPDSAHDLADWCLDRYARDGIVGCAWFQIWLPEMRAFRDSPRFQRFTARLRLPPRCWDAELHE